MEKVLLFGVFFGIACLYISCNNQAVEKYTDKHGNIFIKNGENLSIIPAKYTKEGKTHQIFIYNETEGEVGVIKNITIAPDEFIIANLVDTTVLELDNGVKFKFGETYGLEVVDKEQQVCGLGEEYLERYKISDEIEWAFVIVPKGKGD